jgi:hypothetical protein
MTRIETTAITTSNRTAPDMAAIDQTASPE